MNVAVEGKNIDITAGESILCALRRAGTDFSNPAEKPVAAMRGLQSELHTQARMQHTAAAIWR